MRTRRRTPVSPPPAVNRSGSSTRPPSTTSQSFSHHRWSSSQLRWPQQPIANLSPLFFKGFLASNLVAPVRAGHRWFSYVLQMQISNRTMDVVGIRRLIVATLWSPVQVWFSWQSSAPHDIVVQGTAFIRSIESKGSPVGTPSEPRNGRGAIVVSGPSSTPTIAHCVSEDSALTTALPNFEVPGDIVPAVYVSGTDGPRGGILVANGAKPLLDDNIIFSEWRGRRAMDGSHMHSCQRRLSTWTGRVLLHRTLLPQLEPQRCSSDVP